MDRSDHFSAASSFSESTALDSAAGSLTNSFQGFSEQTEIRSGTPAQLGAYRFQLSPLQSTRSMLMQIERDGETIINAPLPLQFAKGELRSASIRIRGTEYLLLAVSSASRAIQSSKRWFAMFRADGRKVCATPVSGALAAIVPTGDGIALHFSGGASMKIRV